MCLTCSHPSRLKENNCRCQEKEIENLSTFECKKINQKLPKLLEKVINRKRCSPDCEICDENTLKCKKCIIGKNRS